MAVLEPSDGVFGFYWSTSEEFEYAHGPFDTAQGARAAAITEAEVSAYGPEPGETVWIARCDKRITVAPAFDIEAILGDFADENEECWGEDGWDGLSGDAVAAEADLQQMLKDAFTAWEVKHRDKIKVWCFGQVEDVTSFEMPELTADEIEMRVFRRIWTQTGFTRSQIMNAPDLAASARKQIDLLTLTQAENLAEKTR